MSKYKILNKNKHYIIVEKPSGMLTHQAKEEDGLAEKLAKEFPEIADIGEKYRCGIVHRLDRGVSGIILIARSEEFFKYIKEQFKAREVKKIYLGLVYGKIERDEGEIDFKIARAKSGKMAARPEGQEGREAKTEFDVLERFVNYTYLKIQILTGRTHQIRAHMLGFGHPIVGDNVYKLRKQKIKLPCELERIFLHSHVIGFKDLKGEWKEYKSELPKALKECLKKLK